MKKFYVKKNTFQEVDLPMTRRHTRAGVEYAAEDDLSKTMRSFRANSVGDASDEGKKLKLHPTVSSRVITETDLTSSSLYKYRKAQIDSNDDEESNITGSRAQLIERSTDNLQRHDPLSSLPSYLPYSAMTRKVQRAQNSSRSCCCYTMVSIGLFIAVACIGMGIGGVVYMELFTKSSNHSARFASGDEESNTEEPYGYGGMFEFGNITRIVLGDYFIPDVDFHVNDLRDKDSSGLDEEYRGVNLAGKENDGKNKNILANDTMKKQEVELKVKNKILPDMQEVSEKIYVVESVNALSPTSSDAKEKNVLNSDNKLVENTYDEQDSSNPDVGLQGFSEETIHKLSSGGFDKNLVNIKTEQVNETTLDADLHTVSDTDSTGNTHTPKVDTDKHATVSFNNIRNDKNADEFENKDSIDSSVGDKQKIVLAENITHENVIEKTTVHPEDGFNETHHSEKSGKYLDEKILRQLLDEDKKQHLKRISLGKDDNAAPTFSESPNHIPFDFYNLEVQPSASSKTTTVSTYGDFEKELDVTKNEHVEKSLMENDRSVSRGDNILIENDGHSAYNVLTTSNDQKHNQLNPDDNLEQVNLTTHSHQDETTHIEIDAHPKKNRTELDANINKVQDENDHVEKEFFDHVTPVIGHLDEHDTHLQHQGTTVPNELSEKELKVNSGILTEASIFLSQFVTPPSELQPTEHLTQTKANINSGDRFRFDLDNKSTTPNSSDTTVTPTSSVPEKITPFEFLRRLEMDQKLSELPPLSEKDMNMQFSLAEAIQYLRSLDSNNKLPNSDQQIPHKRVTRSQSKEDLEFERKRYLNNLRKQLYDNEM